jgi:hypothetical protein
MSEEAKSESVEQATPDTVTTNAEQEDRVSGIRQVAVNADVMAGIQGIQGQEGVDAAPSFFIQTEDRHRVELDVLFDRKTGRIASISKIGLGIDFEQFNYFNRTQEWFEFSIPTYEDMTTYRQRCSLWRREANRVVVDNVQLRNFLLVWHLKDWSLRGSDGKKIELKHNVEGALNDDSLKFINALSPTLVDVVMTLFEKDVILT